MASPSASADLQLFVERGLETEQRLLVVQARAVDQEYVLRALAERIDARARNVDVRLCERIGNPREQAGPVACDDLEG